MPDTEVRPRESALESLPPSLPAAAPLCANCGSVLTGPFCSHCGQHVADFHRSVWRFVSEFLDNAVCWDNKLLRTLEPLFKYPGLLTQEFMVGRRVRYVHPLRLFLFTSAVCLALLQYNHDTLGRIEVARDKPGKSRRGVHFTLGYPPSSTGTPVPAAPSPPDLAKDKDKDKDKDDSAGQLKHSDDALGDSIRAAVAAGIAKDSGSGPDKDVEVGGQVNQMIKDKIARSGGADRFARKMGENFQGKLSWVALALLPVFALGMHAVYRRRDCYYFAHLIFSLHYHTFLFLFWTLYTALAALGAFLPLHSLWAGLVRLCLLWPPIYLYLALRRLHDDSRRRTVVKVMVLGSMHLVAILIGVAAIGAMAFLTTGD